MEIEKEDTQGLIARGYTNLPSAVYIMLKFMDKGGASSYLMKIAPSISNAIAPPENSATHAAFGYDGLRFLGTAAATLQSFSRQFKEGMTEPHRQFVLGDVAYNSPNNWEWGAPNKPNVHMVLMLFAKDDVTLENALREHRAWFKEYQLEEIIALPTIALPEAKEHFGFTDSISQPMVRGLGKSDQLPEDQTTPTGEFILGYHNWYRQYPDSPEVQEKQDPKNILEPKKNNPTVKDLGRNGSYMIFRQLSQDVPTFWEYMKSKSLEPKATSPTDSAIKLASKMVGRWPSGTPLVKSPDQDNPEHEKDNDFNYWDEDFDGLKCPVGAHIRRTNPRDWLLTEKTKLESKEMVEKHRLLRRGRSYGEPLVPSMDVEKVLNTPDDGKKRGLHFICFVGDITRQFEFIQNSWVKFNKFGGLYDDSDPLIGTHTKDEDIINDNFTVPARPIRRRYAALPAFTAMEGGGYFFFPGIRAFQYIASLK